MCPPSPDTLASWAFHARLPLGLFPSGHMFLPLISRTPSFVPADQGEGPSAPEGVSLGRGKCHVSVCGQVCWAAFSPIVVDSIPQNNRVPGGQEYDTDALCPFAWSLRLAKPWPYFWNKATGGCGQTNKRASRGPGIALWALGRRRRDHLACRLLPF